jgi:hypothetical protein
LEKFAGMNDITSANRHTDIIFQHSVTTEQIHQIKSRILDMAARCIDLNNRNRQMFYLRDLEDDPIQFARDFTSILYYGNFPSGDNWTVADILAWKWSEMTGKYIGCQFWSNDARTLFLQKMDGIEYYTIDYAQNVACNLARRNPDINKKITHEHVFPRSLFCQELQKLFRDTVPERNKIKTLFSRLAIGCVVLESEHRKMKDSSPNRVNPWRRYEGITLVENPNWPKEHQTLIDQAKLQIAPA